MLQPKRRKYRKEHKGRNTGIATRGNTVAFGEFGLKSVGRGRLTARQIEAGRRAITRHVKRGGRIWIRVFPDKPSSTWPKSSRARCCTKSLACPKSWRAKRSHWPLPSCRCARPLSRACWASKKGTSKMKTAELRQKDVAALLTEVKELQKAHFNLRMQKATQQLNNTAQLAQTRRAIARAKTVIAEKLAAESKE